MKNYKKEIFPKLLLMLLLCLLGYMIGARLKPSPVDDAWTEIGGPARSPSWYAEHCDYIEIDPLDESPDLPDGIYENCDELSTKTPNRGWNKDKPDPRSDKWGDGAYEFRTLWYAIVY